MVLNDTDKKYAMFIAENVYQTNPNEFGTELRNYDDEDYSFEDIAGAVCSIFFSQEVLKNDGEYEISCSIDDLEKEVRNIWNQKKI